MTTKSCLQPTDSELAMLKIISSYPGGIKSETLACKLRKKRLSTIEKTVYQLFAKGLVVCRYAHMQCFYAARDNASEDFQWGCHSNFS